MCVILRNEESTKGGEYFNHTTTAIPAPVAPQTQKPTFASLFSRSNPIESQKFFVLPTPYFKGDIPAIKIDECAYLEALESCKHNLIGRPILPKGSKPYKCVDLHRKLSTVWSFKQPCQLSPLGRGYYCLHFQNAEDQLHAWTVGSKQLNPGSMKLSQWMPDFDPSKIKQTNAQVWV